MKTILLVGGKGYIGKHIVEYTDANIQYLVLTRECLYSDNKETLCKNKDDFLGYFKTNKIDIVINLVSDISQIYQITTIVEEIKRINCQAIIIQIASISEFSYGKHLSKYAKGKKEWNIIWQENELLTINLYCGMVYGKNYRMEGDLKKYRKVLLGTRLGKSVNINAANIIDICNVIYILCTNSEMFINLKNIYYLGENINIHDLYKKCGLHYETQQEIPSFLQYVYLKLLYSLYIKTNNTMKHRICSFIEIYKKKKKSHYGIFYEKFTNIKKFEKVCFIQKYIFYYHSGECYILKKENG